MFNFRHKHQPTEPSLNIASQDPTLKFFWDRLDGNRDGKVTKTEAKPVLTPEGRVDFSETAKRGLKTSTFQSAEDSAAAAGFVKEKWYPQFNKMWLNTTATDKNSASKMLDKVKISADAVDDNVHQSEDKFEEYETKYKAKLDRHELKKSERPQAAATIVDWMSQVRTSVKSFDAYHRDYLIAQGKLKKEVKAASDQLGKLKTDATSSAAERGAAQEVLSIKRAQLDHLETEYKVLWMETRDVIDEYNQECENRGASWKNAAFPYPDPTE